MGLSGRNTSLEWLGVASYSPAWSCRLPSRWTRAYSGCWCCGACQGIGGAMVCRSWQLEPPPTGHPQTSVHWPFVFPCLLRRPPKMWWHHQLAGVAMWQRHPCADRFGHWHGVWWCPEMFVMGRPYQMRSRPGCSLRPTMWNVFRCEVDCWQLSTALSPSIAGSLLCLGHALLVNAWVEATGRWHSVDVASIPLHVSDLAVWWLRIIGASQRSCSPTKPIQCVGIFPCEASLQICIVEADYFFAGATRSRVC